MKLYLFIVALIFTTSALAGSVPMNAGVARISVTSESNSSEILVWYPTETSEVPWQAGPFMIPASRNAEVAGGRFPVVLLSHGGGLTGGTPLILLELSASLARHGFIVIAPFHGKAPLAMRAQQVVSAWQTVREDARFQLHLDAERLGMIGFSLGGAVALELAGAIPDILHYETYCAANPSDAMSCHHAPGGSEAPHRQASNGPAHSLPRLAQIKALVLLDPFAALFTRSGLASVSQPTLLFRPIQSQLAAEANAASLMKELPRSPALASIPGGHFVFTDVCTPALLAAASEICTDPEGTDRAAIHRLIERQIEVFLEQNL